MNSPVSGRYASRQTTYNHQQPNEFVFSLSLLVVCALLAVSYLGVPLRRFLSSCLWWTWNFLVWLVPARLLAVDTDGAEHALGNARNPSDGAAWSLHQKKSTALAAILKKAFSSEKGSLLYGIHLNALSAAATSVFQSSRRERPPGLENPSNSCFQNSVLQGLASLPSFQKFVQETSTMFGFTMTSTNGALAWTMHNLNDPEWQGRTLWTPPKLMPMNIVQQQDAQEYFSRIMESMDKELTQKLKPVQKDSTSNGLYAPILNERAEIPSRELREHQHEALSRWGGNSARYSHLRNPVDGLLAQRLVCTQCHYSEGISLVPFNTLTVPLSQQSWSSSDIFENCLYEYLKAEELDGVECAKCTLLAQQQKLEYSLKLADSEREHALRKDLERIRDTLEREDFSDRALIKKLGLEKSLWSRTIKTKQLAIARAPKALVIHVQRSAFNPFTYRQEKNNAPVKFPIFQDVSWFTVGGHNPLVNQNQTPLKQTWPKDTLDSMLPADDPECNADDLIPSLYILRAVVGHSGTHDYGHYVCFRKFRPVTVEDNTAKDPSLATHYPPQLAVLQCPECLRPVIASSETLPSDLRREVESERWWRLSDESVWEVTEESVAQQANAFMLFYERVEPRFTSTTRCQPCLEQVANTDNPKAKMDETERLPATKQTGESISTIIQEGSLDLSTPPPETSGSSTEFSKGGQILEVPEPVASPKLSNAKDGSHPPPHHALPPHHVAPLSIDPLVLGTPNKETTTQLITPPCTPKLSMKVSEEFGKALVEAR